MTTPSTPTTPGTHSRGLVAKYGEIIAVDGNIAYVRTSLTETIPVRRDIMRAKGRLPDVGETWSLVRELGYWTFGLILVGGEKSNQVPIADVVGLADELYNLNFQQTINISNIAQHTSQIAGINNSHQNLQARTHAPMDTGSVSSTVFTTTRSGAVSPVGIGFTAPPSGKVMVFMTSAMTSSAETTTAFYVLMTYQLKTGLTLDSGTTIISGSDANSLQHYGDDTRRATAAELINTLTPGTAYNITAMFRVGAGTGTVLRTRLDLVPCYA